MNMAAQRTTLGTPPQVDIVSVCMYTCMYVCASSLGSCVYVCMCVCVYVCMCMLIADYLRRSCRVAEWCTPSICMHKHMHMPDAYTIHAYCTIKLFKKA